MFDPEHSESLSEMLSELDRNIDSECLADVSLHSSQESREAQAVADDYLAHLRAAGGAPPEPFDFDEIE